MPADAVSLLGGAAAPPQTVLGVAAALPGLLREVDVLLRRWKARAEAAPDPELRRQALASLRAKRFHCEGGAVFALAAGGGAGRAATADFIVALQTISDYLDNLCDRSPAAGAADFRQMHLAMRHAVTPDGDVTQCDYYRLHPHREDGGYLRALVATCRASVSRLAPGPREHFSREASQLVAWYCALQELKHLPTGREAAVRRWAEGLADHAPGLQWWETAAATGSTLGVFALYAAAAAGRLDAAAAGALRRAYFPWVAGLHILLDYWIDGDEDRRGGDMNFTFYYPDHATAARRLHTFGRQACRAVAPLPAAGFHRVVVRGLPALYLADPKVAAQGLHGHAWRLLRAAGPATWALYWAVRALRARGHLRPVAV